MPILNIDSDLNRFKGIIRGRIRGDLKKFMSSGELIGKQGKDFVSIPLPQIELPRFRHGRNQTGGVGAGEGDVGDPLGQGEGDGSGQAGSAEGEHLIEVDVSISELAEILGEELALPRIQPRGKKNVVAEKDVYTGISQHGPESLRHFKRTYREALKRQISSGTYSAERPRVIPIKEDKRYRSWKSVKLPDSCAVIVYMMDVSGSMGDEQKEIVRSAAFWIDAWLAHNYKGLATRFIVHDASAREVDRETFFHTRESGGTLISSAYKLAGKILDADYDPQEWNTYLFHFSDGDNWSGADTRECMNLLKNQLLPRINQFCYGQVESEYGSGQFIHDLTAHLGTDERVVVSKIEDRDGIMQSIQDFLGKGR